MKNQKTTIHDIARQLNVTASTVSRAMSDSPRISKEMKKQVRLMAKKLNYQPNYIASALRSGKSKLIGVLIPRVDRNFFSSVVRGIENIANELDYKVVISQSNENYEKEVKLVEAFLNAQVDGIIASIGNETADFGHFKKIQEKGIPLVLFDRTTEALSASEVKIDDYQGAYEATKHLIDQGCKAIVHFTSDKNLNIYRERLRGYLDALRDRQIEPDSRWVIPSNLQLEDGKNAMKQALETGIPFDGIFSAADYALMGAMQVLKERNIHIPGDFKIVGFGNEPFTSFTDPPVSTVDQKSTSMGEISAQTFFDLLNADQKEKVIKKTVLIPELIVRQSSLNL